MKERVRRTVLKRLVAEYLNGATRAERDRTWRRIHTLPGAYRLAREPKIYTRGAVAGFIRRDGEWVLRVPGDGFARVEPTGCGWRARVWPPEAGDTLAATRSTARSAMLWAAEVLGVPTP